MGLLRALNCQKMRFFQARAHPDFPPNPNHRPGMTGKLLLVLPGPFPTRRCSHGPAGRVHSPFSPLLGAQIFFLSRIWSKSGSFSGAAFSCSSKALCQQERWVNPQKNPGKSAAASGMLLTGAAGTGLAVGIGLGAFHTSSALPRQSCTLPDPPAHSHSVQSHHESPK